MVSLLSGEGCASSPPSLRSVHGYLTCYRLLDLNKFELEVICSASAFCRHSLTLGYLFEYVGPIAINPSMCCHHIRLSTIIYYSVIYSILSHPSSV